MATNPFDQFDSTGNAFDQFDAPMDLESERARGRKSILNVRGTSALGAGARGAGRAIVPTAAGVAAFGPGAAAGAGLGALTGPAAPIAVPVGTLIGGLFTAIMGGAAAGKVQDAAIDMLPEGAQRAIGQDDYQRALDTQEHPIASFAGEMAPGFLFGRPTLRGAPVEAGASAVKRVFAHPASGAVAGAGLGGALEVGREIGIGEDLDPRKIAIAAGVGAAQNKPTALGQSMMDAGAKPTSAFVAKLFQERGSDIVPSPNPLPQSQQQAPVENTPELRALIRSNDEAKVREFFDANLDPNPSWSDLNELTKFKNGLPEQYAGRETFQPVLESVIDERRTQLVQRHIDEQTKTWQNRPDIDIAPAGPDIPQDALGMYNAQTGRVQVFPERVDSPETLTALLYHESLGHYGLAQRYGDELDTTINTLLERNVSGFGKKVDAWMERNPDAYGGDRIRAAEEVLAEMSNDGVLPKSVSDALIAKTYAFARKMGMTERLSEAEVRQVVRMGQAAVLNGKGRDVVGNGFRFMNDNGEERPPLIPVPESAPRPEDIEIEYRRPANDQFDPEDAVLNETPYGTTFSSLDEVQDVLNSKSADSELIHDALDYVEVLDEQGQDTGDLLERLLAKQRQLRREAANNNQPMTRKERMLEALIHAEREYVDHVFTLDEARFAPRNTKIYKEWKRIGEELKAKQDEAKAKYEQASEDDSNRFMRRSQLPRTEEQEMEALREEFKIDASYVPNIRTDVEVFRQAADLGFNPSEVKHLGKTPDMAVRVARLGRATDVLAERLRDNLARLDTPDWSVRDKENFVKIIADYKAVTAELRNSKAEAARSLRLSQQLRYTRPEMEMIGNILRDEGGDDLSKLADDDAAMMFARQLKVLSANHNPAGINTAIRNLSKPYWEQYATALWQNSLLSGLSTPMKIAADTSGMIVRQLFESGVSSAMYPVRAGLQALGLNVKPGVHPMDTAVAAWGLIRSALDTRSYQVAAQAFNSPRQTPRYGTIQDPNIGVLSLPTKVIAAEDAFFREIIMGQNLRVLGAQKAREDAKAAGKKLSMIDMFTDANAHAASPTLGMIKEAERLTEETLLMNSNSLTKRIDKARAYHAGMSAGDRAITFGVNFLTPFVRTSMNALLTQTIRRTPLTFFDPTTWKQLRAGGVQTDMALGRIVMATALFAYIWAQSDPKNQDRKLIGGGPNNPRKREELQAGGWLPNSVRDEGRYSRNSGLNMSLIPFGIDNNTAITIADLRESIQEGIDEKNAMLGVQLGFMSLMNNISRQTIAADIGEAFTATTEQGDIGESKWGRFVGESAKRFVPNIIQQANRNWIDPAARDVRGESWADTAFNIVKSAIPGASQTLPVKHTVYGAEGQTGATLTGIETPFTEATGMDETTDPAEMELHRLAKAAPILKDVLGKETSAIVTRPQQTIQVNGTSLRLNTAQFQDYQREAGQRLVNGVRTSIESGQWEQLSDIDKVKAVRKAQTAIKKAVKVELLQTPGWLTEDQLDKLRGENGE